MTAPSQVPHKRIVDSVLNAVSKVEDDMVRNDQGRIKKEAKVLQISIENKTADIKRNLR